MEQPQASRPHMPGYGILPAGQGTGLLPWAWAQERLRASTNYWLATSWPDGRPHVMPVWGVWLDGALWWSSGLRARKARNLARDPRCTVTTQDPDEPVVIEGSAAVVRGPSELDAFVAALNAKYQTAYTVEFLDPAVNGTYRLAPTWAFALDQADFGGSPTRWTFG